MTAVDDAEGGADGNDALRALGQPWLDVILVLLAVLAFYATGVLTLRALGVAAGHEYMPALAALVALVPFVARRGRLVVAMAPVWRQVSVLPARYAVLLGLALRAAWILAYPSSPASDGATYLDLGRRIAAGAPYVYAGTYAYWPPGYPAFLAGALKVWGDSPWAYLASNLLLFAITALAVHRLTLRIASRRAARLAVLALAVWPNLVFSVATPEKELVTLAMLPCMVILLLGVGDQARGFATSGALGVLMGCAALVQPSLQLLVPAFAAIAGVASRYRVKAAAAALLVVLGCGLVVAPWTMRNFRVFGRFVALGTNGGYNLYRANNPLATGGYTERGAQDLSALSEYDRDAEGRRLARSWILSNPAAFVVLAAQKQILFMGDDAVGAYTTFRTGGAPAGTSTYAAWKGLANAWWLAAWGLLAGGILAIRASNRELPTLVRAMTWMWIYLLVLHSVFEGAGKYHVPMLWVLCLLLGSCISALIAAGTERSEGAMSGVSIPPPGRAR